MTEPNTTRSGPEHTSAFNTIQGQQGQGSTLGANLLPSHRIADGGPSGGTIQTGMVNNTQQHPPYQPSLQQSHLQPFPSTSHQMEFQRAFDFLNHLRTFDPPIELVSLHFLSNVVTETQTPGWCEILLPLAQINEQFFLYGLKVNDTLIIRPDVNSAMLSQPNGPVTLTILCERNDLPSTNPIVPQTSTPNHPAHLASPTVVNSSFGTPASSLPSVGSSSGGSAQPSPNAMHQNMMPFTSPSLATTPAASPIASSTTPVPAPMIPVPQRSASNPLMSVSTMQSNSTSMLPLPGSNDPTGVPMLQPMGNPFRPAQQQPTMMSQQPTMQQQQQSQPLPTMQQPQHQQNSMYQSQQQQPSYVMQPHAQPMMQPPPSHPHPLQQTPMQPQIPQMNQMQQHQQQTIGQMGQMQQPLSQPSQQQQNLMYSNPYGSSVPSYQQQNMQQTLSSGMYGTNPSGNMPNGMGMPGQNGMNGVGGMMNQNSGYGGTAGNMMQQPNYFNPVNQFGMMQPPLQQGLYGTNQGMGMNNSYGQPFVPSPYGPPGSSGLGMDYRSSSLPSNFPFAGSMNHMVGSGVGGGLLGPSRSMLSPALGMPRSTLPSSSSSGGNSMNGPFATGMATTRALDSPTLMGLKHAQAAKSHKGTSCHQCKNTKPLKKLAFCSNQFNKRTKPEKRTCRKKFCESCLKKFYNENLPLNPKDWTCPSCCSRCICAACVRHTQAKKKSKRSSLISSGSTVSSVVSPSGGGGGGDGESEGEPLEDGDESDEHEHEHEHETGGDEEVEHEDDTDDRAHARHARSRRQRHYHHTHEPEAEAAEAEEDDATDPDPEADAVMILAGQTTASVAVSKSDHDSGGDSSTDRLHEVAAASSMMQIVKISPGQSVQTLRDSAGASAPDPSTQASSAMDTSGQNPGQVDKPVMAASHAPRRPVAITRTRANSGNDGSVLSPLNFRRQVAAAAQALLHTSTTSDGSTTGATDTINAAELSDGSSSYTVSPLPSPGIQLRTLSLSSVSGASTPNSLLHSATESVSPGSSPFVPRRVLGSFGKAPSPSLSRRVLDTQHRSHPYSPLASVRTLPLVPGSAGGGFGSNRSSVSLGGSDDPNTNDSPLQSRSVQMQHRTLRAPAPTSFSASSSQDESSLSHLLAASSAVARQRNLIGLASSTIGAVTSPPLASILGSSRSSSASLIAPPTSTTTPGLDRPRSVDRPHSDSSEISSNTSDTAKAVAPILSPTDTKVDVTQTRPSEIPAPVNDATVSMSDA